MKSACPSDMGPPQRTMTEGNSDPWRWYHHVLFVLCMAAFAIVWSVWLKPSDRVSYIVLAVSLIGFVVSFTIIQIRKRRQRKA